MTRPPSTEDSPEPLEWCRARMLVPGHPLALTLPYADPALRPRLLALHTVVAEIAAVPGSVSDPGVAQRKLDWWRQALVEQLPHPALRALIETGAAGRLPAGAWQPLLAAVESEIRLPRFEQTHEWTAHCRAVAGSGAALELTLVEREPEPTVREAVTEMAGAGYRLRMLRDLVLDARRERWWLPLALQAEFQLSRTELVQDAHPLRRDALIRHIAGAALLAFEQSRNQMPPGSRWLHRHLLLRLDLDRVLGRRMLRRPARVARERVGATGMVAALAVWHRARTLQREANRN